MTYAAAARSTYVSLRMIALVVFVALFSGLYVGAVSAAWLLALGYPLKWSAIPASAAALVVWVYAMRQWWLTVQQVESDAYSIAAGNAIRTEPLVIEHRTPTAGGVTTERVKCPVTPDQLQLAARILLPMDRRFNLRSMWSIMGQAKATEFRDWLVREGYALLDDRGMVEITSVGVAMLQAAQKRPTAPQMGEMVMFNRD